MAFRLTDGSVFLHLPRTGGTFITSVLRKVHLIEETIGLKYDCPGVVPFPMTVRHFVFIRHPYSLMKSTYSWLVGNTWGPWPKEKEGRWWHPWNEITAEPALKYRHTFNDWLRWVSEERTGYVTRLYSKFANWPCTQFVGRTEWLEADLIVMLDVLNIKRPIAEQVIKECRGDKNSSPVKVEDAKEEVIERFMSAEQGAMAMWEGKIL